MRNKIIILCLLLAGFSLETVAQDDKETVEITGLVTDQKKEPLVGVNVYVAEVPGLGTITGADGKYKIKVPQYTTAHCLFPTLAMISLRC